MRTLSAAPLTRVLAVLAMLAGLLVVQSTGATPARATELGGVFTDVQIIPGTAGPGATMEISAAFAIPAGAVAGDTFTLTLNDPFNWVADSFDILDPDTGEVVAHVVVTGTLVTFTLTDYVESHLDISGSTSFYTYFDRGSVEAGDVVEATFTTKDDTFIDEVTIEPPGEVPATRKEFRWTDRSLQDGFTFAILVSTLDAVPNASRSVQITDIPSVGVLVTCASLVFELAPDVAGSAGAYASIPAAQVALTCPAPASPRGFAVRLTGIPADSHVRVRGTATVTDPGLASYRNVARVGLYGATPIRVVDSVRRFASGGQAQGSTPTTTTTTTSSTTTSSTTTSSTTTSRPRRAPRRRPPSPPCRPLATPRIRRFRAHSPGSCWPPA